MSLNRLIFYGAIIGGWSAFVGWMVAEILLMRGALNPGFLTAVLTAALVGAAIAGGLGMLGSVANGQWAQMFKRLGPGLVGGLLGGLVGGLVGNGFFFLVQYVTSAGVVKVMVMAIGWTVMGISIGAVEGIWDRSPLKLRNGLIGGAVGGILGGVLFLPISGIGVGGMAGRATAFVILGMCIGLFIAVVQVVLKDAWLTVVDGFRPGRQLIITEPETFMGTAEQIALPFIAFGARGVEPRHVRIVRQPDGTYVICDNNTRSGTKVNGQPLTAPAILRDGDMIGFGVNVVRFSERRRGAAPAPVAAPSPAHAHAFKPAAPQAPVVTPVAIQPIPVQPVAPPRQAPPVRPMPPTAAPPTAPVRPMPPTAPRPTAQPPAAAQRPPAQPPRPTAPQPPAAQRPPGAAPQGARADPCPNCGARVTGQPGKRFCMICETTF